MSVKALAEIEASIEHLDLQDQVRLLEYLTPKIAKAVLTLAPAPLESADNEALRRFRALGERLAATSVPGAPLLTHAASEQRR